MEKLLCSISPPGNDPLGVLGSTAPVAEGSRWVRIDGRAVLRFARSHPNLLPPARPEEKLHCTFLPPERFLNYLLVLEALNFSFWDEEPRWRVSHGGGEYDGYWALAAALHRAVSEEGLPLWEARFLAEIEEKQLALMLRGKGRPPPLLPERAANLREVGRILLERWGGQFANLVAASRGEAVELTRLIAAEFPSFRDEALWRGKRVLFLKRAQICAADLSRLLPGHPLGRLTGLEGLTAFADYKVPQVLRKEGILLPVPDLAERIDRLEPLEAGSGEEVEIRAATIWACEWIARVMGSLAAPGRPAPTAAEVDYLLWSAGQDKSGLPPYHRTRTIFY